MLRSGRLDDPTCSENGWGYYECCECQHWYCSKTEYVEETCTEDGYSVYECDNCGHTWTEVYEAYGCNDWDYDHCCDWCCTRLPTVQTVTSAADLESEHNYADDADDTWYYAMPGVSSFSITFSEDTYVEEGCDYIKVYYVVDGEEYLIGEFDGYDLANTTVEIPSDTVKIQLTTDYSVTDYGFKVVEVSTVEHQHVDTDDHLCDICGAWYYSCYDNNHDHICDWCGVRLSDCYDDSHNHYCDYSDICGASLHDCVDENGDGHCDICSRNISGNVSDCVDAAGGCNDQRSGQAMHAVLIFR